MNIVKSSNLDNALGISDMNVIPVSTKLLSNSNLNSDSEYAIDSIHQTIKISSDASNKLFKICEESMEPRAFEVLAILLKQQTDSALALMKIHKDKQEIECRSNSELENVNSGTYIANAVFAGTSSELLSLISGKK